MQVHGSRGRWTFLIKSLWISKFFVIKIKKSPNEPSEIPPWQMTWASNVRIWPTVSQNLFHLMYCPSYTTTDVSLSWKQRLKAQEEVTCVELDHDECEATQTAIKNQKKFKYRTGRDEIQSQQHVWATLGLCYRFVFWCFYFFQGIKTFLVGL